MHYKILYPLRPEGIRGYVWSATGSPPPPPIQNRACEFPSTRLLSVWSSVIDTSRFVLSDSRSILGGFLIVAMPMVHPFVVPIILSATRGRDDRIGFETVSILKGESTSWALSLLKCEKLCLLTLHEWVLLESLCPLDEITVIRAYLPSDLYIVLTMGIRRMSYRDHFRISFPVFDVFPQSKCFFDSHPVFVINPSLAFPRVSCLPPSKQWSKGVAVASLESLTTHYPSIVVRPSSNHWIENAYHCILWG